MITPASFAPIWQQLAHQWGTSQVPFAALGEKDWLDTPPVQKAVGYHVEGFVNAPWVSFIVDGNWADCSCAQVTPFW